VPLPVLIFVRALFPSWRFFDHLGHVPHLYYRLQTEEHTGFGNWELALKHKKRTFRCLFLNPHDNLQMAYQSLVEQLVSELQEPSENQSDILPGTVSYNLVQNFVRFQIMSHLNENRRDLKFQFKVVVDEDDLFISLIHGV
jgi:hypothetical protein